MVSLRNLPVLLDPQKFEGLLLLQHFLDNHWNIQYLSHITCSCSFKKETLLFSKAIPLIHILPIENSMMVHTHNLSTLEAGAGWATQQVLSQPGYIAEDFLKNRVFLFQLEFKVCLPPNSHKNAYNSIMHNSGKVGFFQNIHHLINE